MRIVLKAEARFGVSWFSYVRDETVQVNPVDDVDDTIRNLLDDEVDDVRRETAFRVCLNYKPDKGHEYLSPSSWYRVNVYTIP